MIAQRVTQADDTLDKNTDAEKKLEAREQKKKRNTKTTKSHRTSNASIFETASKRKSRA